MNLLYFSKRVYVIQRSDLSKLTFEGQ
uniref:Uncharacterized protein n=1 Tax=Arundo donax TaxID=35708 RepID=A0A0A9AH51_ARUDO